MDGIKMTEVNLMSETGKEGSVSVGFSLRPIYLNLCSSRYDLQREKGHKETKIRKLTQIYRQTQYYKTQLDQASKHKNQSNLT